MYKYAISYNIYKKSLASNTNMLTDYSYATPPLLRYTVPSSFISTVAL